jgi:hypothetical protein
LHACFDVCLGCVLCLGGVFKLELFLPEEYPMAAPKVPQVGFSIVTLSQNLTFMLYWMLNYK